MRLNGKASRTSILISQDFRGSHLDIFVKYPLLVLFLFQHQVVSQVVFVPIHISLKTIIDNLLLLQNKILLFIFAIAKNKFCKI